MQKNIVILVLLLCLSACEAKKVEYSYPKSGAELKRQKIGSMINDNDGGGINIVGSKSSKAAPTMANSLLWRASLETISFMPLHQSDPIGGIIITDWYAAPDAPKERFKMNIVISSAELKVSSLKVTVFKEVMDNKGNWSSAVASPQVARDLEDKIINKAKALNIGQR
jgi:Domain of unknown function (DUF3576)